MMEQELDFRLFNALRDTGRKLRSGRPSGSMPSCCDDDRSPIFRREIILAVLHDSGDGMRQNQIAGEMKVNASTLSEMLNRLEEDGMIVRTPDSTDKRATLLTLTDKGVARAEEIKTAVRTMFSHQFSALSEEEKKTLIALLDKINQP